MTSFSYLTVLKNTKQVHTYLYLELSSLSKIASNFAFQSFFNALFFCNLGHLSWARSLATRFLASLVGSTYSKSITGNTNSVSQRGILTFPPARPSRTMPSFNPDGLEVSLECLAGNPNEGRDTSWVEEAAGGSSFIVKCLSEIKELHDPFWSSHSQLTTASSSNLLLSLFRSVCVCARAPLGGSRVPTRPA